MLTTVIHGEPGKVLEALNEQDPNYEIPENETGIEALKLAVGSGGVQIKRGLPAKI